MKRPRWFSDLEHDIVVDEHELRRATERYHVHAALLALAIIVWLVVYTIGASDLIIVMTSWMLSGCQEYTDYVRRY